ncbi:3-keto-disaccharide hydrolase [Pedobacter sp. PWIIR3]
MKILCLCLAILLAQSPFLKAQDVKKKIKLFDGKTFNGWQGDTAKSWRIENGAIVGGRLDYMVPHNEFISTTSKYSNYILKLKFKLTGTEGFVNGGVQFHSERIANPDFEMKGYQADIGDGFWASLYDESRRDKLLITADPELVKQLLKRGEWNDYEIRTQGRRIQIFLNGTQTVDYTEEDQSIPQSGLIAFQLHGGGKTEISYKNMMLYPNK